MSISDSDSWICQVGRAMVAKLLPLCASAGASFTGQKGDDDGEPGFMIFIHLGVKSNDLLPVVVSYRWNHSWNIQLQASQETLRLPWHPCGHFWNFWRWRPHLLPRAWRWRTKKIWMFGQGWAPSSEMKMGKWGNTWIQPLQCLMRNHCRIKSSII